MQNAMIAGAAAGSLSGAVFFGAPLEGFVLGGSSAALVLVWLPGVSSLARGIAGAVLSCLIAGFAAPVLVSYVAARFGLSDGDALRGLLAVAIGAGAPVLIPVGIDFARRRFGKGDKP